MSLFLRNLFFTILQPGIVAILIPFWLSGKSLKTLFVQIFDWYHYLGLTIFTVGLVIMLICIISFGIRGKGTLSPADPTKKLVISGLYRFSRNPMYIGVMMMLIGESIFFRNPSQFLSQSFNIIYIYMSFTKASRALNFGFEKPIKHCDENFGY